MYSASKTVCVARVLHRAVPDDNQSRMGQGDGLDGLYDFVNGRSRRSADTRGIPLEEWVRYSGKSPYRIRAIKYDIISCDVPQS